MCVSFLASFIYLQEMPCTVEKVRGECGLLVVCAVSLRKSSSFCNIKTRILSVCQHPRSHRRGSVGEICCSCRLSLSADKYSSSLHHFWFLNVRMHDYSPNPLPLEHKRGAEGGSSGWHPRHQRQLARRHHGKGRSKKDGPFLVFKQTPKRSNDLCIFPQVSKLLSATLTRYSWVCSSLLQSQ